MSDARIEQQESGIFLLAGDLSFDTVSSVWTDGAAMVDVPSPIVVDLRGVTRTDSAGLALLVEWLRHARCRNKRIRFKNVPPQMMALARVAGLDSILPFE